MGRVLLENFRLPGRGSVIVAAAVCLAATLVLAQPQGEVDEPRPERAEVERRSWDEYRQTVVAGNIFSRQRGQPASAAEREAEPDASDEPEEDAQPQIAPDPGDRFALRGIFHVNGTTHAFFEDRRDGAIRSLAVGDDIAGRRIVRLTLDEVHVSVDPDAFDEMTARPEDDRYAVKIGWSLSGRESGAAPPATATGRQTQPEGASAADASSEEADAGDGELSIREQMRRRRQQQLQQQR